MTPIFFVLASVYLTIGVGFLIAFKMERFLDRLTVVVLWPYLLLIHVGFRLGQMIVTGNHWEE